MSKKKSRFKFKLENTLEERIQIVKDLKKKFGNSGKVPIICEKDPKSKLEGDIKSRYMLPKDLYFSEFMYIIREKLNLDSSIAIFLIIDDKYCVIGNDNIELVYEKYKEPDGILYLHYSDQQVFGKNI
jgi:GABA(A) receptor-associated protein